MGVSKRSPDLLWPAPAKLNLFLHITNRRDDGYHELQTVFQFLDIHDDVKISVNDSGEIHRLHHHNEIPEAEDLVIRAAQLLQQETGCSLGADIELIKRLPIGGGIGGGSSDAATVLVVLNNLWGTGLNQKQLADLGLQLGADVPVFVHGHACWAEGVGEQFQPVEPPEKWYVVIFPNVHVSTGQVFSSEELTRNTPPITIAAFLAGRAGNDCEPVVRDQVKEVDEAMIWLDSFSKARLTGTGACIFAAFDTKQEAKNVADQCPAQWQSFVTQGRNYSPLHQMLEDMR